MTAQEMKDYRIKLFRDATSMENKPDRLPHLSNFWTWQVLDMGYKFSQATHNYDVMEKVMLGFHERYGFDGYQETGIRNPQRVTETLGDSIYVIDDEKEIFCLQDHSYLETDEYDDLIANPTKFVWEKVLPRKFYKFRPDMDPQLMVDCVKENQLFWNKAFERNGKLEAMGVPGLISPKNGFASLGIEYLFSGLRGIKGISIDMRRSPEKVRAACDALDSISAEPVVQNLIRDVHGPDMGYCFDMLVAILAHTILNMKQWEMFYWPPLKRILDEVVAKGKTIQLFIEGSFLRFADYFKDYPKGHIALQIESDDILEVRRAFPNCCVIGGMTSQLLGQGTKEQCVDRVKYLIDELGPKGFILGQDKMMSYRIDAKPENVMAVCDYVRETKL